MKTKGGKVMRNLVIEEMKQLENEIEDLSKLLTTVVDDGASIGFYLHWNKKKQQIIGKRY